MQEPKAVNKKGSLFVVRYVNIENVCPMLKYISIDVAALAI